MDNQILHLDSSEAVLFYGDLDHPVPDVFNDNNNDGKWQAGEQFTVLSSNLEGIVTNIKLHLWGYYEIGRDKEITFGHEYNFQHGYMPLMLD